MKVGSATALGGSEIFARSRGSRTSTASLLNAKSPAFNNFTLQTFFGSVGLVGCDHFDEPEAAGLFGVRIKHDRTVLNITIFLEKAGHVGFGKTRMNTSDEEVRSGVNSTFVVSVSHAGVRWRSGAVAH